MSDKVVKGVALVMLFSMILSVFSVVFMVFL